MKREKGEEVIVAGIDSNCTPPLNPDIKVKFLTRAEIIAMQTPDSPGLRWCVAQMDSCEADECVMALVFSQNEMLSFKTKIRSS